MEQISSGRNKTRRYACRCCLLCHKKLVYVIILGAKLNQRLFLKSIKHAEREKEIESWQQPLGETVENLLKERGQTNDVEIFVIQESRTILAVKGVLDTNVHVCGESGHFKANCI